MSPTVDDRRPGFSAKGRWCQNVDVDVDWSWIGATGTRRNALIMIVPSGGKRSGHTLGGESGAPTCARLELA